MLRPVAVPTAGTETLPAITMGEDLYRPEKRPGLVREPARHGLPSIFGRAPEMTNNWTSTLTPEWLSSLSDFVGALEILELRIDG